MVISTIGCYCGSQPCIEQQFFPHWICFRKKDRYMISVATTTIASISSNNNHRIMKESAPASSPNVGASSNKKTSTGSPKKQLTPVRGRRRHAVSSDDKNKGKSKSKSPIRTRKSVPEGGNNNRSGSRSLSPFRLLRPQKNLRVVPEAMNEGSSDSFQFSNSAAFRQEQMIQAFASEDHSSQSLHDPEDPMIHDHPAQIEVKKSKRKSQKAKPGAVIDIQVDLEGDDRPIIHAIDETDRENDDTEHDDDGDALEYEDHDHPLNSPESVAKRNSLERLKELPDYYGGGGSSSNHRAARRSSYTRQSGTSSTLASGISRLSFTSMTSFNSQSSMPSLSSIVEHDLMSVGTNGTTGNSTVYTGTSSIGSTNYTGSVDLHSTSGTMGGNEQSIVLSLTPPPGEARIGPTYSSSSNSMSTNSTLGGRGKGIPSILSDHAASTAPSSFYGLAPPTVTTPSFHRELYHLAGTTLDVLGPAIENPHKNLPQQRWESDAPKKVAATAGTATTNINGGRGGNDPSMEAGEKIPHGNPDVAPLTHAQKLLLPNRRSDVQPIYVARRGSDASTASASIGTMMQQGGGGISGKDSAIGLGALPEFSPIPIRPTLQTSLAQDNQYSLSPINKDTLPTYAARRTSSNSTMSQSLGSGSMQELAFLSPDVNHAILQLPRRSESGEKQPPVTRINRRGPSPLSATRSSDSFLPAPSMRPTSYIKDTVPTYFTRRLSSNSAMASGSFQELAAFSPEVNPAILQLPRRSSTEAAEKHSTTRFTSRGPTPLTATRSSDSFLPPPPPRPPSPPPPPPPPLPL